MKLRAISIQYFHRGSGGLRRAAMVESRMGKTSAVGESLVSGFVVLAVFASLALMACGEPYEHDVGHNSGEPPTCPVGKDARTHYEGLANEYKRELEAAENANKRCGSPRPLADYESKTGCDRKKLAENYERSAFNEAYIERLSLYSRARSRVKVEKWEDPSTKSSGETVTPVSDMTPEQKANFDKEWSAAWNEKFRLQKEWGDLNKPCSEAEHLARQDTCSQPEFERRNATITAGRDKLAKVNQALQNIKQCEEQARKSQDRAPAIDAGTVLQGLGGALGGARARPTQRTTPPSHGHKE